jgi:hypothetical protein
MTITNEVRAPKVKSIAVIGGGASGAVVLDSLIQEQLFEKITLFERRDVLGGVWVLDEQPDKLEVPPGVAQEQLDPQLEIPQFDDEYRATRPQQQRYEQTASYNGLRTNIPEQLMTYSDVKQWDAVGDERVEQDYVRGNVIQRYVETYLNRHKDHIVFRTTVESVTKDYTREDSQFELVLRTETDEVDQDGNPIDLWTKQSFDAVIIATGHYHVPFIPSIPGIQQVYHNFPGLIEHSKTFRDASSFKDKTIIVIGSRSSGADIVELGSVHAKLIVQSKRGQRITRPTDASNVEHRPIITRYEVQDNNVIVHFEDGSTVTNPDKIIYATGFRYSYPFLNKSYPSFTTGYVIPDLYQHTFYNKDPLLSLVGVPTDAISFRAFEYQAVLVARFLAQKVSLPPIEEQIRWSLDRYQKKGDSRAYHTIDFGKKFEYLSLLTTLGGGVAKVGSTGRSFPVLTEEEDQIYQKLTQKLIAFFSLGEKEAQEAFKTTV